MRVTETEYMKRLACVFLPLLLHHLLLSRNPIVFTKLCWILYCYHFSRLIMQIAHRCSYTNFYTYRSVRLMILNVSFIRLLLKFSPLLFTANAQCVPVCLSSLYVLRYKYNLSLLFFSCLLRKFYLQLTICAFQTHFS